VNKITDKPVTDRTPILPAAPLFFDVAAGLPPPVEEGFKDEEEPMALARKASKVFPVAGALIANTIPLGQWLTWAQ
jgi:hypothetical protein